MVDNCIFEVISPLTILPHSNMPICSNIYMPYCSNIATIFVAQNRGGFCVKTRGFAPTLLFFRILVERKKHVQKFQYYQSYLPACGRALIIGDEAILSQLNMLRLKNSFESHSYFTHGCWNFVRPKTGSSMIATSLQRCVFS